MRLTSLGVLLSSALLGGCGITSPQTCIPGSSTTVTTGIVRDTSATELARVRVVIQSIDGDSIPGRFSLTTSYQGGLSPLAGHVLTAKLVDQTGQAVYDVVLDRRYANVADAMTPLRDPLVSADLTSRLARGSLTLVLTTDLARFAALQAPLTYERAQSGERAQVCFRRHGWFD